MILVAVSGAHAARACHREIGFIEDRKTGVGCVAHHGTCFENQYFAYSMLELITFKLLNL